jgi:ribonuclease BN (tRNA processing enzyme)
LPSTVGAAGAPAYQHLTSYVINDVLAVDAGSLGFWGTPAQQARIRHVLISHSHQDHIASLPMFLDNAFEEDHPCVTVHGSAAVLDCLKRDVFNNRVWFNCLEMSSAEPPLVQLSLLETERSITLGGLRITPIEVDHTVPTFGFVLEDSRSAVIIASDTGPTNRLWQIANRTPNLKAVFLEATWPARMTWLADVSKHLTTAQFAVEVQKLKRGVPVFALHLKARYHDEVVEELTNLRVPNVQLARPGHRYEF